MKLKTIALAALLLAFTFATAQTIKVGSAYKIGKPSFHTSISFADSKGSLVNVYATGLDNYVNAMEDIGIVKVDENLKATPKQVAFAKKIGKSLKNGGLGGFNDKVIVFGNDKGDKKDWPYSIYAIDDAGNVNTANEIVMKTNFNIQLGNASIFFDKGFAKSDNNKYGAVYAVYNSKKDATYISIAVFDNDMNQISNAIINVPEYTGTADMQLMVDNDGNVVGALRDGTGDMGASKKFSKNIYSVVLKKGADEITLNKLSGGDFAYQTIDIQKCGNDYAILGIYKKTSSGKGEIDGASAFLVDINGKAESLGELKDASKFNIFSKGKLELANGTFRYITLPSVKTNDGAVFVVQKKHSAPVNANTIDPLDHYMDVYAVKVTKKGIEWNVRIPAFTSNAPSFQVAYNEKDDVVSIVYHGNPGQKFTSEEEETPRASNNSGKGVYYVVSIGDDGKISANDETTEKYDNAVGGYAVDNVVYDRVMVPIGQEKIRKVTIE